MRPLAHIQIVHATQREKLQRTFQHIMEEHKDQCYADNIKIEVNGKLIRDVIYDPTDNVKGYPTEDPSEYVCLICGIWSDQLNGCKSKDSVLK